MNNQPLLLSLTTTSPSPVHYCIMTHIMLVASPVHYCIMTHIVLVASPGCYCIMTHIVLVASPGLLLYHDSYSVGG